MLCNHIQAIVVHNDLAEMCDWPTIKASILEFFSAKDLAPHAHNCIHTLKCCMPHTWHSYLVELQLLAQCAKDIMAKYKVICEVKKPGTLPLKMHACILDLAADEYMLQVFIKHVGKLFQEVQIAITPA